MIIDIADIEEIFRRAEETEGEIAELTHEQVWRLILCDCELGGFTIEDVLKHRKTGKYPGPFTDYFSSASLLICMLSDELIDEFLK